MKRIFIYILTLIAFTAFSQDYKIESEFETGKPYQFEVKRSKFDSRDPMTKDLAQLTQIEATFTQQDTMLKCVWKYGETKAVGPEHIISQIGSANNELFNIYRGIEIEILFNPHLGGIELLNYEEMKQNIKNGLLKVYKNQMTKIDSATMAFINQQIEPTYSTPDLLLSTYFPEIGLYFNLYSQSFSEGDKIKSLGSYPNPFGGDPFPVVSEIGIESKEENVLLIKNEESANQEEVNRIIKEFVARMSSLGNSPVKKEDIPDFTLNSVSKCHYDLNLKLINKVMYERVIEISEIKQIETLEVILIK